MSYIIIFNFISFALIDEPASKYLDTYMKLPRLTFKRHISTHDRLNTHTLHHHFCFPFPRQYNNYLSNRRHNSFGYQSPPGHTQQAKPIAYHTSCLS
ncbi:hypothetical protein EYC80_004360 [Monilinia laxa]|uniref:Uncharacterized protein n=1 Tax=Monilinia laxa TaxID=61186 RepID=A0A5N6KPM5_MONLA|nr:hypothetical protein EYC80_004360 [Monilinia laxa]